VPTTLDEVVMVGGESPGAGCDLWPLLSRSSLPLAFVRGLEPCSVRCSSFVDHLGHHRLLELRPYYTVYKATDASCQRLSHSDKTYRSFSRIHRAAFVYYGRGVYNALASH
jgi:hypothetical protein